MVVIIFLTPIKLKKKKKNKATNQQGAQDFLAASYIFTNKTWLRALLHPEAFLPFLFKFLV